MNERELLSGLSKFPQKKLGQNFLRDQKVLDAICDAADLSSTDTVIEVGPGLGALTRQLTQRCGRVIAIELDRELAEYIRSLRLPGVTVVTGNALDIDWLATVEGDYKIVANIPYSITSPLLRKIFLSPRGPEIVVLLVQREVAERITAPPGDRRRGYLTLLAEANAVSSIVRTVKPGCFYPAPTVDSAVVKIVPHAESRKTTVFWPAIEAAFRHARQTAVNGIANTLHLPKGSVEGVFQELGIPVLARPAELRFEDWQRLSDPLQELLRS